MTRATSPASSGPAGAHFEGQVGASYLLSMLVGGAPRGLPCHSFDRVLLQRGAEGFPLDDVIVHGHDVQGRAGVLEVQVKRDITFSPSDPVFKSVVAQIARASEGDGFWNRRHELAIATAHSSRKITGAYQDVLTWARELSSSGAFIARIARKHAANVDMRTFVQTFREHLNAAGACDDDEHVWQLLRRVQIQVYDFTAGGSANEELARERAAHALHIEDATNAGALWKFLIEHTIGIAAAGGERSRSELVDDLVREKFRLQGDRRLARTRRILAEASELALADINDRILGASIGRKERLDAIRAVAEGGRYVEIRGDAGVGKSGLLKHFARTFGVEGQGIILSPSRVSPRGWTAMKRDIQCEGTARELLCDMAADGGAYLFIDNLDFFDDDERTTVIDLLRAAAEVPGIVVVATARTHFGADNSNWLPVEALDRLGRTRPVVVNEVTEEEANELRNFDPRLGALLADQHPAKAVARNLFRLGRLVEMSPDHPSLRTEVDMADLWWRTADGATPDGRREQARVLRDLAVQSLNGAHTFDVAGRPAAAIDALISSETLRDRGNDRVAFRHDVLREWAVANLLIHDDATLRSLDLTRPALPGVERGVELATRSILEKQRDVARWLSLLDSVSASGCHKSWRRAVLLAVVHSELAFELLPLVQDALLAQEGLLLRELLPLVMAVDVRSARDLFIASGLDVASNTEDLHLPIVPVWTALVNWLLQVDGDAPRCMPEIVDFYCCWCLVGGMVQGEILTQKILTRFKRWLGELEAAHEVYTWKDRYAVFGGSLSSEQLDRMEKDIRTTFLIFAFRVPSLAADYLKSLTKRKQKGRLYSNLLKFRGSLAQAAPAELAAATLDALVCPKKRRRESRNSIHRGALTYLDIELLPESPAQGPFYDLLNHAPTHGLSLIRALIDAVISFETEGEPPVDSDSFFIELSGGRRRFPWTQTYGWSRSSRYHSVTSALMALEAWAHARIERQDDIDQVLAEILGEDDAPACYLLVVVDILLSHWPATRSAAVPFVACPELLSVDLHRPPQENPEFPDLFGLSALQREPAGPKLDALKKRLSRRVSLKDLLPNYALGDWGELRASIGEQLLAAVDRLGPFEPQDDLGYPRLMAVHALNLVNPNNYREVEVERKDGSKVTARKYASPPEEEKHFSVIQGEAAERMEDAEAARIVDILLDSPGQSSEIYVKALTSWASKPRVTSDSEDLGNKSFLNRAFIGAAVIAMRDGSTEHRKENKVWAESVFDKFVPDEDTAGITMLEGMRYNPVAAVFAGRAYAAGTDPTKEALRKLIEMAAEFPAAAHGAAAVGDALYAVNERLPIALLRVAFAGCIYPQLSWDAPDELKAEVEEFHRTRLRKAIDSELDWLLADGIEPTWTEFPSAVDSRRRSVIRIGSSAEVDDTEPEFARPDSDVDHQRAALWLRSVWRSGTAIDRPWLRTLWSLYAAWTFATNGAGLAESEEVSHHPREWNAIFFVLAANCLPGLGKGEVAEFIIPLMALDDKGFFLVTVPFLRALDGIFFNESAVSEDVAISVRSELAQRLGESNGWRRLRGTKSDGIEMDLGPAGAVLFFNDQGFSQPAKCYLFSKAAVRSMSFLPVLQHLACAAPSPFVAVVLLNWIEVEPRIEQLATVLKFCQAAFEVYPDSRSFWIDHGVGRRVCKWVQTMMTASKQAGLGDALGKSDLAQILASLVAIGVPEATALERSMHADS